MAFLQGELPLYLARYLTNHMWEDFRACHCNVGAVRYFAGLLKGSHESKQNVEAYNLNHFRPDAGVLEVSRVLRSFGCVVQHNLLEKVFLIVNVKPKGDQCRNLLCARVSNLTTYVH
jgi:hypothetical protein